VKIKNWGVLISGCAVWIFATIKFMISNENTEIMMWAGWLAVMMWVNNSSNYEL